MTKNPTIKYYPLSSPQQDIWFEQLRYPDVPIYNLGGYLQINGALEVTVFEQALNQVIQEQEALRLSFHPEATSQTILENVSVSLNYHDFSAQPSAHQVALAWMAQEFVKPFQLDQVPLFQLALCQTSAQCYYWFQKYHHLIVDDWAVSLINQRVAEIYNHLVTGKSLAKPNGYSYLAWVEPEQAYFHSEAVAEHERYWLAQYHSLPEPLIQFRSTA
jgi:hypothetical protein